MSTMKPEKAELLLSTFREATGKRTRVLPSTGMAKLMDAYSIEEIEQALLALMKDPWHKERIGSLSVEYLLRPTTIDKWYEISLSTPSVNQLNDEPEVTI